MRTFALALCASAVAAINLEASSSFQLAQRRVKLQKHIKPQDIADALGELGVTEAQVRGCMRKANVTEADLGEAFENGALVSDIERIGKACGIDEADVRDAAEHLGLDADDVFQL